jgi:hypothetical protein
VSVISYKSLRDSIHVQCMLSQPILDWREMPSRFFGMVYGALRQKLPINLSELSITPGVLLSEVRAKYNLYGGATSVSLHADRLAFDFPNLTPTDYPIAMDIMACIHDAFPKAFSDLSYDKIEVQSYEHVDVFSSETVSSFLERFKMPGAESFFESTVVQRPTCKFSMEAQDQGWQCGLALERSLLASNALFMAVTVSLRNANALTPFQEKQTQVRSLINSLVAAVGLESSNVGT